MHPTPRTPKLLLLASLIVLAANGAHAAAHPILLKVDARDVSRRVLHATLHIPAQPGTLTLVYPKWIPGEHGPSGHISDLAGLKMTTEGQPITWQRDLLDDFCQRFFGGESDPPRVVPYTLENVLRTLNDASPFDWHGFFQQRVYAVNAHAPLGGIERGGWRLVCCDTPSDMLKNVETTKKETDVSFSLGLSVNEDGGILDVIPGLPADRAGVGPGMKLLAVNNRRWKPELLRTAIKESRDGTASVELLVENGDVFKTCRLDYREGERYSYLERDASQPNVLAEIIKLGGK